MYRKGPRFLLDRHSTSLHTQSSKSNVTEKSEPEDEVPREQYLSDFGRASDMSLPTVNK